MTLANLSILTTGEARATGSGDFAAQALPPRGDIVGGTGGRDRHARRRQHAEWSPLMHWAQIVVECHLPDLAAKLESLDSGVAKMEPDVDSRVGVLFRGLREAGE